MSMSIGASDATQRLAAQLVQLQAAQQASATTSSLPATVSAASVDSTDDDSTPPENGLTGSATPSLSGPVLMTLMQLQGGTDGTSSPSSDPLQSLFTAMDTDGNGTVSQREMETYVQNAGGTQGQADALFGALDQSGAGGISESQMAGALPGGSAPAQGMGHHHHHHHAGGSQGATDPLAQLFGTTTTDDSTTTDPLTAATTSTTDPSASGSTTATATSSSPLSNSDFASLQATLQQLPGGAFVGSMLDSMLSAFSGASGTSTPSTTSITA